MTLSRHTATCTLADGMQAEIRSIRLEDEPLLRAIHGELSLEKLRPARLGTARELSGESLAGLCQLDHPQDAGLVAEWRDASGAPHLLGVARHFFDPDTQSAELALEVVLARQGQGLSSCLLKPMIAIAREQGIRKLFTGAQGPMMSLATRFGFLMTMRALGTDGTFEVVRDLEEGINLRKYDAKRIARSEVRFLVSSMYSQAGLNEEIKDFVREMDPAHAVECLDELFNDPDDQVRDKALELLVFLQGPKAMPWIERYLNDEDVNCRCAACGYLAELESPEAVPRLLRCLREDPSDWVRYAAVEGLERQGDKSAISALKQSAKSDRGNDYEGRPIRDRARQAIRQITQRNK